MFLFVRRRGVVASVLGWRHSYLCRVRLIMSVWV
nr:MAG TPA: hypothetical protein [Caudoviricetes sp.]